MVLQFLEKGESLFQHNREFEEGVRERGIRQGQATVVVALDGSGDAESVQEGINMLPATGGIVYIKEGTFNQKLDTTISIGANIQIKGTGRATKIKADAASAVTLISMSAKCSISDVFIDGSNNDNLGINITGVDCFVVNCFIEDCNDNGININTTSRARIMNNYITSGNHGISLISATECLIVGNNITANSGNGINLSSGNNDNIISSNSITSNTITGVYILGTSDNNIVEGNIIKSNSQRGIHIVAADCDKNLLHGNIVLSNTTAQITDAGTATTSADNITA